MRSRFGLITLCALCGLLVGTLAFASATPGDRFRDRSDAYWRTIAYAGVWVDNYRSLDAMVRDSDLVVVGRIIGARPGRVFGDVANQDATYFVENDLAIDEVLFDPTPQTPVPPVITFETNTIEEHVVGFLTSNYPLERAVFFLRNNGEGARRAGLSVEQQALEAGYWHAVNPEGILRDLDGETSPVTDESGSVSALNGKGFDETVSLILGLARQLHPRDSM